MTAEQVSEGIDLTGKVVLITGANTGIGKETARVLALRGAKVFVACRPSAKTDAAVAELKAATADDRIEALGLELGNIQSIRECAAAFLDKQVALHALILNAGVFSPEYKKTDDGFESHIGVNHLGHFLLTLLLLKKLKESAPSRVVVVSSSLHSGGKIRFDDLHWEKDYSAQKAYGDSKLANILFARELNRRLEGTNVTANALHPGVIATELGRDSTAVKILHVVGKPFLKTIEQGAATTVWAATGTDLEGRGGQYLLDSAVGESSDAAKNMEDAARLWELSVKLVKLSDEEVAAALS